MMFRVGDKVRLVRTDEQWDSRWGLVGDAGVVTDVHYETPNPCVRVEGPHGTWWWGVDDIEPADTPHTDDDLAMALELARLLKYDADMPEDCANCLDDYGQREVSVSLIDEVIDALRARGEGQR